MKEQRKIGWSDCNWIVRIAIIGGIICCLEMISAFVAGFIGGLA